MADVQRGLGTQNISDFVRKNIQGIYETKYHAEEQKRKYIRTEQEIRKEPTDISKI